MRLPGVAFLRIMRFSPLSMYVSHPSSSALSFRKAVTLLLFTVSPLLLEPRGIWVRASMYFHTALGSGSSFRSFWQCLQVRKEERTQTQKEPRVLPPRDFWKRRIPADFCRFRRCSRLYRWLLLSWTTKATIFVWTSWSGSSRFAKRCPILNCRAAASMSTGIHFASPHRESSAQVAAKNRYD